MTRQPPRSPRTDTLFPYTTLFRSLMRALKVGSSSLGSSLQLGSGMNVRRSRPAEQPLKLYSFETSPYSRLVRERLCELELPYLLRSTAKGTPKDLDRKSTRLNSSH